MKIASVAISNKGIDRKAAKRMGGWVTNLKKLRLPKELDSTVVSHFSGVGLIAGLSLARIAHDAEIIVLYQPSREMVLPALLRCLVPTFFPPLIIVDHIFVAPDQTAFRAVKTQLARMVWRGVDRFIVHQKDVTRICQIFLLRPQQFAFIPFKANISDKPMLLDAAPTYKYVFCGGMSRRDFTTFSEAMAILSAWGLAIKGVIVTPPVDKAVKNGTVLDIARVPPNVEIIFHDGCQSTWQTLIKKSSLVVVSTRHDSICSEGISVALQAMSLNKPVIITENCATRGIFESGRESIVVPTSDPITMANAIASIWSDSVKASEIAQRGRAFAEALGDESAYLMRIAKCAIETLSELQVSGSRNYNKKIP